MDLAPVKKSMESVLLKIKRQFTHDEAVALLQTELAKANYKNGELLSENSELKHENTRLKKQFSRQLTKEDLKEQRFVEMQKNLTSKGKKIKRLEDDVNLWRSKYFDLINKQSTNGN